MPIEHNPLDSVQTKAVLPVTPTVDTMRADRIAKKFKRRVIWVQGLATEGRYEPQVARNVLFLNPDSSRSVQVLSGYVLALSLAAQYPRVFRELIDEIGPYVEQDTIDAFVERMEECTWTDVQPINANELKLEFTAYFIADFAYRSYSGLVSEEDALRGVSFTGYSIYLKSDSVFSVDAAIERFLSRLWKFIGWEFSDYYDCPESIQDASQ